MESDTRDEESHGLRWQGTTGLIAVAVLVAAVGVAIASVQRPRAVAIPPAPNKSPMTTPVPTPVPAGPVTGLATSIADDPATHRVVLFGGVGSSDKTWLWDGRRWTSVTPDASPEPRSGAAIAYDPATRLVMLFGGQGLGKDAQFNDTWAWNGTTWRRLDSGGPVGPFVGEGGQMAWDAARDQMILVTSAGTLTDGETWRWGGTHWVRDTHGNVNAAVVDGTVAYDPATKTVLLVTPATANGDRSATFGWNGSTWHTLVADGPQLIGLADAVQVDGLVACGPATSSTAVAVQATCWEWASTEWYQLQEAITTAAGTPVTVAGEVDDADRGELLMIGWLVAPVPNNPQPLYVWAWDGTKWTLSE